MTCVKEVIGVGVVGLDAEGLGTSVGVRLLVELTDIDTLVVSLVALEILAERVSVIELLSV